MKTSHTIFTLLLPVTLISSQAYAEMTDTISSEESKSNIEIHTKSQLRKMDRTIFVDQNAEKEGDGKSWATAYRTLQLALDSARPGTEIWVAQGIYIPEGENRTACFRVNEGVEVYGSMIPGAADKSSQDAVRTPTVLSGNIGDPTRADDNCYHVLSIGTDVVLDSLVIQDGFADGPSPDNVGGALQIVKNAADTEPFQLNLNRIIFRDNLAELGGALFIAEPAKVKVNTTYFRTNKALYGGAAMIMGGEIDFNNVHFFANSATFDAGAFSLGDGAQATLMSCLFTNNTAGGSGGALQLRNSLQTQKKNVISIDDTLFTGNRAEKHGGAIHNSENTILTIKDSHLHDNRAKKGGDVATMNSSLSEIYRGVFIEGKRDHYVEN